MSVNVNRKDGDRISSLSCALPKGMFNGMLLDMKLPNKSKQARKTG